MDYVLADEEDSSESIRDYLDGLEEEIGKITIKRHLALWVK